MCRHFQWLKAIENEEQDEIGFYLVRALIILESIIQSFFSYFRCRWSADLSTQATDGIMYTLLEEHDHV